MHPKISYWIDESDIIRKVDDYWDLTLEDPTAQRVKSQAIIGKPLFDFICDDITRMYVRTLLQSVRLLSRSLRRPYRCDSPNEKRYMEMIITLEDNGLISVTHELLRTEPIFIPVAFHTIEKPKKKLLDNYNIHCSLCNRLRLQNSGNWQEIDTIEPEIKALNVVYGVCDDCMKQLKTKNHVTY
jgi:hypothetical protein